MLESRSPAELRPEIPDKLYFRIGEVSRLAGNQAVRPALLGNGIFLTGPEEVGKGHRLYRRKDVELVLEIKRLLYDKRYTIEGARKYLDSRRGRPRDDQVGGKQTGRPQPALFHDPTPVIQQIRKELTELLEILNSRGLFVGVPRFSHSPLPSR